MILFIISRDASTVRLPAFVLLDPFISFCLSRPPSPAAFLLPDTSGLFQEHHSRRSPSWPLHQSSGHVPGALANRPKPCLGCFVYHTGPKANHIFTCKASRREAAGEPPLGLLFYGVISARLVLALISVCLRLLWSPSRTSYHSHGSAGIHHDADAQALTGGLRAGEGRGEELLATA